MAKKRWSRPKGFSKKYAQCPSCGCQVWLLKGHTGVGTVHQCSFCPQSFELTKRPVFAIECGGKKCDEVIVLKSKHFRKGEVECPECGHDNDVAVT